MNQQSQEESNSEAEGDFPRTSEDVVAQEPTLTDLKPRPPQPGAALPAPSRSEPQIAPHFGDQEPEDPRRTSVDDAPSLSSKDEAGPDRAQ